MNNESEMTSKTANGENESNESNMPFSHVPKIAEMLGSMTEREREVAIALAQKEPGKSWDTLAKKLGMSVRQLYNYRTKQNVLEVSSLVVREMCRAELPEVLKRLVKDAKAGKHWAVKLFLELTGELNDRSQLTNINVVSNVRSSEDLAKVARDAIERARNLTTEQLQENLLRQLKLSSRGIVEPDEGS